MYGGIVSYDLLAGWPEKRGYLMSKGQALEKFPFLESSQLKAAVCFSFFHCFVIFLFFDSLLHVLSVRVFFLFFCSLFSRLFTMMVLITMLVPIFLSL
jgi:hypothetical protein